MKTKAIDHIVQLIVTDTHEKVTEAQSYAEQNKDCIERELQLLIGNQEEIRRLADKIFPEGIQANKQFYTRISNAAFCLGRENLPCQVLGNVLGEAYQRLLHPECETLLQILPACSNEIFLVLPLLPEFLSRTALREEFSASWFLSLGSKIANDLANGPFFDGVYEFAMHFPNKGLQVLEIYKRDKFDSFRVSIATAVLAGIRTCEDKGREGGSW